MTAKFFALLTNIGAAKLANATALGTRLEITHMAVGDGGGTLPTPNPEQTQLVNEQRRAALNMLTVDPINTSQIIAEQVIPETEGGWWIREIGLLDKDGDLIAIANCAETYKPQLQEGSGRTQTIRVILIVSSTAAVTLKIDPSVVLATRKYVDDKAIEAKVYADDLLDKHIKTTDPHKQYLKIDSNLSEINAIGEAAVIKALANLKLTESLDGYVGRSVRVTTFPESGTITFTANTKIVRFKIWGAGQGGGSATAVTSPTGGASGAGGGYVEVIANIKALGLATVAITIGSGGAPAILNSGTQGGAGGATVVGTLATANGGVNGTGGSVSVNSLIGTIIAVNGQNGQGGGVSGTGATGGAASGSFGGLPHASSVGDSGGFPGGGAAGGANIGPSNNYIGGRGANGLVIVEEYA